MQSHPKAILVSLDADTAAALDRVAPGKSRQRSRFIRDAIRHAIDHLRELETAAAYARQPDGAADVLLVSAAWEPAAWDEGGDPAAGT